MKLTMENLTDDKAENLLGLVRRIACRPQSTEDLQSTWCPPDWEDVVGWWDEVVAEARTLTGEKYR